MTVKQVTLRQLQRAKAKDIRKWLPCDVLADGEIVGRLIQIDSQPNAVFPQPRAKYVTTAPAPSRYAQADSQSTAIPKGRIEPPCPWSRLERKPQIMNFGVRQKEPSTMTVNLDADQQPIPEEA